MIINKNKQWILVTGASKGIGFSICQLMLELNYNVIAVSRDTTTLEELNVDSEKLLIIPCDLSKNENVFYLFDEIEDFNITHIFNNAGLGLIGSFAETDISKEIAIINTNISALVILTKLFLQKFNNEKTNGKIINIGSLAGNVSGPLQSVYYASKAFVNNFTESVQYEMKQENNYGKLILVLPGQVKTNFRKSAGGKVQEGYNVYWYVKKLIYLVFHSNKEKIVIGVNHKITDFFSRLFSSRISKKFLYKFAKEK